MLHFWAMTRLHASFLPALKGVGLHQIVHCLQLRFFFFFGGGQGFISHLMCSVWMWILWVFLGGTDDGADRFLMQPCACEDFSMGTAYKPNYCSQQMEAWGWGWGWRGGWWLPDVKIVALAEFGKYIKKNIKSYSLRDSWKGRTLNGWCKCQFCF